MHQIEDLERGRESYARQAWTEAYGLLSRADRAAPLGADDLDLLAVSADMLGFEDEWSRLVERTHHAYLDEGQPLRAVRCAFWLCINLAIRGEMARASGWLGRAQRLLQREESDCVERGYLLMPIAVQHEAAGNYEAAYVAAAKAAAIAERFGDADLLTLAVHEQGAVLVKGGRVEEGLALLDEAMVAVTADELSPLVTGLVYCSVIAGCQEVYALRRAQEWTAAMTRWCEQQPDMVSFTGRCLIHRAEIMQLHGAWPDALEEAQRAGERFSVGMNLLAAAEASYRRGELLRLRGEVDLAEEAYREASQHGWEPQPGLALLRLAQGNRDAAAAAIRRVAAETTNPLKLTRVLPAYVEIMLAVGEIEEARRAGGELEQISTAYRSEMLDAMVAQARGAVELADANAQAALVLLRQAAQTWRAVQAPYESARARELVGRACAVLGDDDAALLELEAARGVFEQLGAAPDLTRMDALAQPPAEPHGLTPRELQVLRLVAAGTTNKAIAAELVLSERTVDRHVSNIFTKLRVPSRAAATAYAYEHQLV